MVGNTERRIRGTLQLCSTRFSMKENMTEEWAPSPYSYNLLFIFAKRSHLFISNINTVCSEFEQPSMDTFLTTHHSLLPITLVPLDIDIYRYTYDVYTIHLHIYTLNIHIYRSNLDEKIV